MADRPIGNDVVEPFGVSTVYCEGASDIRVTRDGDGHLNLSAYQLESDDEMARVMVGRLLMKQEVMRELAMAMLTETMVSDHRRDTWMAERREKMN